MRKALIISSKPASTNGLPDDEHPKEVELVFEEAAPSIGGMIISINGEGIYLPFEVADKLFNKYEPDGVDRLNKRPA